MFNSQVAPSTPQVVVTIVSIPEPIEEEQNVLKISNEFCAKFWSLFNLLIPAWDLIFASKNFFHNAHHLDPKYPDKNDLERYCHSGDGWHIYLWLAQIVTFLIYYVASVLFLLASFGLVKKTEIRMGFVRCYMITCIGLVPVIVPGLHFIIKVQDCKSEGHFWLYYFLTLFGLLVPMVVFGILVSLVFLDWLKKHDPSANYAASTTALIASSEITPPTR